MRRVVLVFCFIVFNIFRLSAQVRGEAYMPSFFIDVDANSGLLHQQVTTVPLTANYPGLIDPAIGKVSFSNGLAASADVHIGLYLNNTRTVGIGTGLSYNIQSANLGLDSFHVEFRATDDKGNVFRQLITADHAIAESVKMTSINIPLLLIYRKNFSGKFFITAEGGLVYNAQTQNSWNTNANFDYEAVYKFTGTGSNVSTVYDNSATPGGADWLITRSAFLKDNSVGDVNSYFATKNAAGYSVGLNEQVKSKSGSFKLASGSLGYTVAAALNFKITKKVFFKLGGYYLAQSFSNTSQNNSLPLTSKISRNSAGQDTGVDYNSLFNSVKTLQNSSYGITIGLKFFISSHSLLDYE